MRARFAVTARLGALSLLAGALVAAPGTAFAGGPWGADYFPNVPLVNQDGVVVRFYDDLIKGKAVAVNLIYTHCTASCPLETAKMAQVQKLLGGRVGKDIFFYSISIDPKRDTPETLKAAWAEENERRRVLAEQQAEDEPRKGIFASIRKVFGGQ